VHHQVNYPQKLNEICPVLYHNTNEESWKRERKMK
jgi:hypothetical protein